VMNDEQCGKEIGLRNGNNIAQMWQRIHTKTIEMMLVFALFSTI
jgi:hypothetical protein